MGPHPAVAEVRRAVRGAVREPTLVACSGGADSLALAAAVAFESARAGRPAGLVTVDHGLQDGSAQRAAAVAQLGYELGFDPVHVVRVDVGGDGGPEAAARVARYRALDSVAERTDAVLLLGHTLDDQAETVLLGLGRGSGPRSIAGMRPRDGRRSRPLLDVRRETTRAACVALGLPIWDDPHNAEPRFRRSRIRAELLPLMEDVLGGGVAAALARTGRLLADDLDALDELTARDLPRRVRARSARSEGSAISEGSVGSARSEGSAKSEGSEESEGSAGSLDLAGLADEPAALRTRVLRGWIIAAGVTGMTAERIAAVDRLVTGWRGQDHVDLPGGFSVRRRSGRLHLRPRSMTSPPPLSQE